MIEERHVSKTPGTPPDIVLTANYAASCANTFTCNQPNSTIDARGGQTDYTYDGTHGGVLTVTAPADASGVRPQTRVSYTAMQGYYKNSAGSIVASGVTQYVPTSVSTCLSATSANPASCVGTSTERKVTTAYGPQVAGTANNLLPVSLTVATGDSSVSATTTASYDSVGNRTSVDGPLAGTTDTTVTRYDAARQVVGVVGPDPDGASSRTPTATRLTYNVDGQVTQQEVGTVTDQSDAAWANFSSAQQQVTTYDANARPVKTELKAGGTTYAISVQSYDALGRPDCSAVRMDPAQWAAQADACTPQITGPNGPDRIARATYDAASQVTAVTTGYGTADAVTEASSYTANGKQASVKDGEANLTTYEYDGFDRLVKTRYPLPTAGANASSTTDYEQLTYDAGSNVTQRRLRDGGTIDFVYDNLNRLTTRTPSGETAATFQYDLTGHLTQMVNAQTTTMTYDALGRELTESQPYGSASYQYDVGGRMTRLTWSDGLYATYDYDTAGNVTAIRENGATSGVGVLATYTYDNLGRRTGITRGNGTSTSYAFDAVSRLSSTTQDLAGTASDQTIGSIAYNPAGQIQSQVKSNDAYAWLGAVNANRNYTVNGLNQQTAAGATALTYDARGNLVTSGTSTYGYDKLNQMVTAPGNISFAYDPAGRMINYNVNGATTRFAYAGSALIQEANPSGVVLRRYVPGPGMDEPIVWYEGSTTTDRRWLHADERGSVIAVSDGSGAMLAINRYDEYGIPYCPLVSGQPDCSASGANVGRFQYTGQMWLPELGMYNYKARMYSPTLGRFMQSDPIGYGDGLNWYNYVGSDPINANDPSGLDITVWGLPPKSPFGPASGAGFFAGGVGVGPGGGAGAVAGGGIIVNGHKPKPPEFVDLYPTIPGVLPISWTLPVQEIVVVARKVSCGIGNAAVSASGDINNAAWTGTKVGAGITVGGLLTANPVITEGGVDVIFASDVVGTIGGATQFVGGTLQVVGSGHGWQNMAAPVISGLQGWAIGRFVRGFYSPNLRGNSLKRATRNSSGVGTVTSGATGVADFFEPKPVQCPQ